MKDKHIFIILAHSDNLEKKRLLNNCLNSLKSFDFTTILVSHLDEENDCDFFIKVKNNEILTQKDYSKYSIYNDVWFENGDIKIAQTRPTIHDYAVFQLLQAGVSLAESLDKKFIHVITYDCKIDKEEYIKQFVWPIVSGIYHIISPKITGDPKRLVTIHTFSFISGCFGDFWKSMNSASEYFTNRASGWQLEHLIKKEIDSRNLIHYINDYPTNNLNLYSEYKLTNNLQDVYIGSDNDNNLCLVITNNGIRKNINIYYPNYTNLFYSIGPAECLRFNIGKYSQGSKVCVYWQGKTIYSYDFNLPVDEFRKFNSLFVKRNESYELFKLLDECYYLGMSQVREEIYNFILFCLENKVKNFLEIGTDYGGTFLLYSNLFDGIKISVDLPYNKWSHLDFDIKTRNRKLNKFNNVHLLEGDSKSFEIIRQVKEILGDEKLDMLFIDADHRYQSVKADYEIYKQFVKKDGIIAFHDILSTKEEKAKGKDGCEVYKFWGELNNKKKEFIFDGNWGGIGVIINESYELFKLLDESYNLGMTQVKEEIHAFALFCIENKVENFLEVGTDRGGTFLLYSNLFNGIKISVDMPHGKGGYSDFDIEARNRKLNKFNNVYLLEGDSKSLKIRKQVKQILGDKRLDMIFIDGDHAYEAVKRDYNIYSQFVKKGGIIGFHDILDTEIHRNQGCEVSKFWQELEGEKREFIIGGAWGGIGVIIR